jgi:oligosaccharide repeat unit polymerase
LTGIESYFLGNVMIRNNGCKLKVINVSKNVFPAYLGVVLLLIFILKEIIFPSVNIYKGEGSADPSASGGIWGYFVLFSRMIIMSVICFQFRFNMNNNKKWYKNDLVFWFFLIIFFIVNIRLGRRGIILQYLLIIFFYVSVISGGFKLRRVLFSVLLGLISLNIILITRSGGSGAFNFSFNVFDMALDLIINNRNTFLAVDYVEKNGVLFPPFLGTLLGVIPFLSSLFFNALNIGGYYQTSAVFFSYLTFGQEMQFGVGTNIIASLYLSLGILGVIVGMFCLGLLVSHLMNKFYQNSYFGSFAYTILVSYSVYWVRSEFFTFVRYMVWGLLFYSILSISKYFFKIYHS